MSTNRCEHGNVTSDTVGEYRCFECEPVNRDDLAARDQRIERLERVVAELAFAAGIHFLPSEGL